MNAIHWSGLATRHFMCVWVSLGVFRVPLRFLWLSLGVFWVFCECSPKDKVPNSGPYRSAWKWRQQLSTSLNIQFTEPKRNYEQTQTFWVCYIEALSLGIFWVFSASIYKWNLVLRTWGQKLLGKKTSFQWGKKKRTYFRAFEDFWSLFPFQHYTFRGKSASVHLP